MAKVRSRVSAWVRDVKARRRAHAAKKAARTRAVNARKLRTKSCKYIAEGTAGPIGIFKSKSEALKRCKKELGTRGGCRVIKSCIQMR